jgi:hypothetical protein
MAGQKIKESPEDIVEHFVKDAIQKKPYKISLQLDWNNKKSVLEFDGLDYHSSTAYPLTIDFSSFARGLLNAYKKAYGQLYLASTSFREEVYKNDKVAIELYLTGSAGIFDVYIEYE